LILKVVECQKILNCKVQRFRSYITWVQQAK